MIEVLIISKFNRAEQATVEYKSIPILDPGLQETSQNTELLDSEAHSYGSKLKFLIA